MADVDQNGNVLARYVATQKIDEPLAELRSNATSYYEADGLGSVTSLTTSAGALGNTYVYDSFGKVTGSSGSITNRFEYTGREFDSETGLYYYRARYYDPTAGRFLSEDPTHFEGGKNFYVYAVSDPVNGIDPFGLNTTIIIIYDTGLFGITYGSHAALLIDNGGDPMLYDPAGSYSQDNNCGSGDTCDGSDADLNKFKNYHQNNGSGVALLVFPTTPEEEKHIADRINNQGGAAPGYCASSVSDAIKGIGPFKNFTGASTPGGLHKKLQPLLPRPMGSGSPFGGGGGGGW